MAMASLSVNEDKRTYWAFLKQLKKSQAQPFLRWQPECVNFTLAAGHNSVIFRADKSDLYICGYSRDNGAQFWEFADSSLIPGSRPLNFSRSYFGSAGFSKFGSDRYGLPLGYDSLFQAVTTLATTEDPKSSDEVQRCMLVVIQMISEAASINPVAELIVESWNTSEPLPSEMRYIQNALHKSKFNKEMVRFVSTEASSEYSCYWRSLLYVDCVRINTINGGNIHGTVEVQDDNDVFHIAYNRSRENPEKIGQGENLSLIGPSAPILGEDVFNFFVKLWDGDIQIADGFISFERRREGDCDKVLDEKVKETVLSGGEFHSFRLLDSVSVRYWVITLSHFATVEVLVSSARVYGKIEASYFLQKNSSSSTCLKLFDKPVDQYVEVGPEEHIPIARPNFPVPVSSKLTIQFNLVGQDGLALRDSWEVCPYIGTQLKNFTGECGNVEVLITFQCL